MIFSFIVKTYDLSRVNGSQDISHRKNVNYKGGEDCITFMTLLTKAIEKF